MIDTETGGKPPLTTMLEQWWNRKTGMIMGIHDCGPWQLLHLKYL
jgi:hypothetical protein